MIELPSTAEVDCSAQQVFDLITDLNGQGRWLPGSSAFHGTIDISSNPVRLGTTYREPGPSGVRNGEVTEFEPPTRITFHQPMTMRFGLGVIDVAVRYRLTSNEGKTNVSRVCVLSLPWQLRAFKPIVVRQFRTESARTLAALKAYADNQRK